MATTTHFKRLVLDKDDGNKSLDLEFGITSSEGENAMYIKVDDRSFTVDHDTAKRICDGMRRLAHHYGFDKDRSR
jgi:hypothetical protein